MCFNRAGYAQKEISKTVIIEKLMFRFCGYYCSSWARPAPLVCQHCEYQQWWVIMTNDSVCSKTSAKQSMVALVILDPVRTIVVVVRGPAVCAVCCFARLIKTAETAQSLFR